MNPPAGAPSALIDEAVAAVRARRNARPRVGVVLGSGLSGFAANVDGAVRMPYAEIPHFPKPTAEGHGGQTLSMRVGDHRVLVFVGRIHAYEGHELRHVVHPVRTACAAGARTIVLTNAAGGLREDFSVGSRC